MYKKFLFCFIIQVVLVFVTSCITFDATANRSVSLDRAIQMAARSIEANVETSLKIALLNFRSPSEQFSEYVLEELSSQLVQGRKLIVVDRRELDLIRQEEEFQLSSIMNDESARAIGKKLGAQLIVSGSLNEVGKTYRFRIRAINVETAAIEASPSANIRANDNKVVFLLDGKGSIQVNTNSRQTTTAKTAEDAAKTGQVNTSSRQTTITIPSESTSFKIGDRGPAGGIIFYDKGTFSDGWQYLEVAPVETEFTAEWSKQSIGRWSNLNDVKDGIGFGKSNTEYIDTEARRNGYNRPAAQLCVGLNFKSFNDWFLPSIGELDLIYKNLKQKGLGGFGNNLYWSSSMVRDKGYRAWYIRFNDGRRIYGEVTNALSVRAIRAF